MAASAREQHQGDAAVKSEEPTDDNSEHCRYLALTGNAAHSDRDGGPSPLGLPPPPASAALSQMGRVWADSQAGDWGGRRDIPAAAARRPLQAVPSSSDLNTCTKYKDLMDPHVATVHPSSEFVVCVCARFSFVCKSAPTNHAQILFNDLPETSLGGYLLTDARARACARALGAFPSGLTSNVQYVIQTSQLRDDEMG
ncbi:hypothetical protein G7046_g7195 [Stylonectria norvegica]|nr:hypothetical protein G7046_g7195 [Stylonectria norvegica]